MKFNCVSELSLCALLVSCPAIIFAGEWLGFVDRAEELKTQAYDFGVDGGGNENYYDGDFADIDGDGRMDRALISRYGLLWNTGGGVLVPASTQVAGRAPNSSPSLTGYLFGDEVRIGNDAVQWADIDNDGDLDNVQGGNGEPFTIQVNRRGRFSVKRKYTSNAAALNIVSIDIDRDGDVDLASAHAFCSNSRCGHGCPEKGCGDGIGTWAKQVHLWVNDGNGNFTDEAVLRGLPTSLGRDLVVGVIAGDVDGDRDFDLLMETGCSDGVTVGCETEGATRGITLARNDGKGFFSLEPIELAVPVRAIGDYSSGFTQGMNLGDIDDDGDLDLVCALRRDLPPHPQVAHAIFMNDGMGNYVEESAGRFITAGDEGFISGANGKLMDVDYDNDLDFVVFNRRLNRLDILVNDGLGFFTFDPVVSSVLPGEPSNLGNDTDVTDINGDGTYDVWIGSAGTIVRPMINTFVDPSGLRADTPRDVEISASESAVVLSFRPPRFAATARHYRIYRSLAPGIPPRDRKLLKTIAISPFEDEGFAAPITRHTTTDYLGDPDVELDQDLVVFTDTTAIPGVTYYYSVVHVGTENTTSRPTAEVSARIAMMPPAQDTASPLLDILSPDAQWWSQHPRVVVQFADPSEVDLDSLSVSFDKAIGGQPPDANIADRFFRKDANSYVYAAGPQEKLESGLATLTVRISDVAGNETVREVTFNVNIESKTPPVAGFTAAETESSPLEYRFESSGSMDVDGIIMRREWYFGDGAEAIGEAVVHRYELPGNYSVSCLVRDNEGGVAISTLQIEVAGGPQIRYRRSDANCDGTVDVSDAIFLLEWLFSQGGPPCCLDGADANGDTTIDVSDAVFTLLWLFAAGLEPPEPGPESCGLGNQVSLGCLAYPGEGC